LEGDKGENPLNPSFGISPTNRSENFWILRKHLDARTIEIQTSQRSPWFADKR
jgi:hypothetical protein